MCSALWFLYWGITTVWVVASSSTPTSTTTSSSTPTATFSVTGTATSTPTPTTSSTSTVTPTGTFSSSPTPTVSCTYCESDSATPTGTATTTSTFTYTATYTTTTTSTTTPTVTATSSGTSTTTMTATLTSTTTFTTTGTMTTTPTATPTQIPTATQTMTSTSTPTSTKSPLPTVTPTSTPTGTRTKVPVPVPPSLSLSLPPIIRKGDAGLLTVTLSGGTGASWLPDPATLRAEIKPSPRGTVFYPGSAALLSLTIMPDSLSVQEYTITAFITVSSALGIIEIKSPDRTIRVAAPPDSSQASLTVTPVDVLGNVQATASEGSSRLTMATQGWATAYAPLSYYYSYKIQGDSVYIPFTDGLSSLKTTSDILFLPPSPSARQGVTTVLVKVVAIDSIGQRASCCETSVGVTPLSSERVSQLLGDRLNAGDTSLTSALSLLSLASRNSRAGVLQKVEGVVSSIPIDTPLGGSLAPALYQYSQSASAASIDSDGIDSMIRIVKNVQGNFTDFSAISPSIEALIAAVAQLAEAPAVTPVQLIKMLQSIRSLALAAFSAQPVRQNAQLRSPDGCVNVTSVMHTIESIPVNTQTFGVEFPTASILDTVLPGDLSYVLKVLITEYTNPSCTALKKLNPIIIGARDVALSDGTNQLRYDGTTSDAVKVAIPNLSSTSTCFAIREGDSTLQPIGKSLSEGKCLSQSSAFVVAAGALDQPVPSPSPSPVPLVTTPSPFPFASPNPSPLANLTISPPFIIGNAHRSTTSLYALFALLIIPLAVALVAALKYCQNGNMTTTKSHFLPPEATLAQYSYPAPVLSPIYSPSSAQQLPLYSPINLQQPDPLPVLSARAYLYMAEPTAAFQPNGVAEQPLLVSDGFVPAAYPGLDMNSLPPNYQTNGSLDAPHTFLVPQRQSGDALPFADSSLPNSPRNSEVNGRVFDHPLQSHLVGVLPLPPGIGSKQAPDIQFAPLSS